MVRNRWVQVLRRPVFGMLLLMTGFSLTGCGKSAQPPSNDAPPLPLPAEPPKTEGGAVEAKG